jgi:hypothetical protein
VWILDVMMNPMHPMATMKIIMYRFAMRPCSRILIFLVL